MLLTTKFLAALFLAVLLIAVGQESLAVNVVNNWYAPFTQGQCSWDLHADSGTSGTVHIVYCIRACAFRTFID
jgi:hypothetical protein